MKCPRCQRENPSHAKFCLGCGTGLALTCAHCGTELPADAKFCLRCGQAISAWAAEQARFMSPEAYTPKHLAEKILTSKGALEGERKQVTVLFADLKGSMELLADRDPEEARKLLDPVLEHMMEAVHRYEGTVNQVMGDGIMALFGAPLAHEDHAVRACYAALRMQERVSRYGDEVQRSHGVPLTIRVGLNSGEVVVRSIANDLHMDYTAVGQTTHLAARMEQMAKPGSIVVSADTHKLTEGYFQFKGWGKSQVKGISERVGVYELLDVGPLHTRLQVAARRGLVRFVGRQEEMEQTRRALELARGGHGQLVAVMGEAGVGKSRLCYEFKLSLQRECLVLETFSASHGRAYPYLPLIELLKEYFQIVRRREKVGVKTLMLEHTLEETLYSLFSLLGTSEAGSPLQPMDPQIRRRRTFEAIKRLLLRESLNQPLVLVFEDLHWLDSETQAFLDIFSESVASARILLLLTYRPDYRHSWGSKTYYTQLRLDSLGREDAQKMLSALLGDGPGLRPLRRLILEKTEGNPFFMEEVVQTLAEERALVGERGNYRLETASAELHIPPTVQGALATRIDRLGKEEKALLQTLAVIGKKFSLSLLKGVVQEPEEELHQLLSHLQGGEFIYEQPAFPETQYTFKHALTQEVVYNSVLMERRRVLHERTAQAIEGLYRDELEEHYSDLAHHYSRSGTTQKAVEYLKLAGQQAVHRSANAEAISHLTKGLELLRDLPDTPDRTQQELDMQTTLGLTLMATKGYAAPEVEKAYTRARELCQQVGETSQLFPVLRGLCSFYLIRGKLETAHELGEQLLATAQRQQDPALLMIAHSALGFIPFYLGRAASAREHAEQGTALYDSHQYRYHAFLYYLTDPGVSCLSNAALALWLLGYPHQALKRSYQALTLAQALLDPHTLVFTLHFAAWLHQFRREGQLTQERAEAETALSAEQGFPAWLAQGSVLRGWALAEQGQAEEGIIQIRQGMATWQATGAELGRPYFLALLAEACGKAGQIEEGLNTLAEALDTVNKNGERWYEAELYRIKGELLMAREHKHQKPKGKKEAVSEAETCFSKAIDIARSQSAKSLELRATISLSRLWRRLGKKKKARLLLADAYGWFTEGFDTADLKEAKALLEELL